MLKNSVANLDPDPDFQDALTSFNLNPERRFLAAFLYRAIVDCVSRAVMSNQARRTAEQYVFGECDCVLPIGYVCSELGLERESIRSLVRDIREGRKELPLLSGQKKSVL